MFHIVDRNTLVVRGTVAEAVANRSAAGLAAVADDTTRCNRAGSPRGGSERGNRVDSAAGGGAGVGGGGRTRRNVATQGRLDADGGDVHGFHVHDDVVDEYRPTTGRVRTDCHRLGISKRNGHRKSPNQMPSLAAESRGDEKATRRILADDIVLLRGELAEMGDQQKVYDRGWMNLRTPLSWCGAHQS